MSVDLSPEERAKIVASRANVLHGDFTSMHEAAMVLAEELWELNEARIAECRSYHPRPTLDQWCQVLHDNDLPKFLVMVKSEKEFAQETVTILKGYRSVLAEAIDVIAVCDRIIAQWGEK